MVGVTHLNGLRALEVTLRCGSFKAAAVELGVTPAAVGQQVRALEDYLGTQLLIRRTKGIEPTRAAQEAMRKLTIGFEALGEAYTLLARRGQERQLSLTVPPSFAQMWLAPRLADFLLAHPNVDLRIDTTPDLVDMDKGEFDLAIRYTRPVSGCTQFRELLAEYILPVCTPAVAERLGGSHGTALSNGETLIVVNPETSDPDWLDWDRWAARFGVEIDPEAPRVSFVRWSAAMSHAFSNGGLLIAGLAMTLDYIRQGSLVAPFGRARVAKTGYSYHLVFQSDLAKSRAQSAFESWIERKGLETRKAIDVFLAEGK